MSIRYLLLVPLLAVPAYAADVQTLSGKKLSGDLVGLDKQTLVLKSADGEIRHPIADVLLIGLNSADQPPTGVFHDLELTDGSILHCTKLEFKAKLLDVTIAPETALSVPYTKIATLCKDAHDPKNKVEFQQFAAKRGKYDMVAIRSEGRLNALEGTLGDGVPPGDGIEFTIAGTEQKATPRLAKIAGLVFITKPEVSAPPAICKIVDVARNALVAANVVWNENEITITTVSGLKISYSSAARLARLDFSQGKLVYLSDLDPARAETNLSTEDNGNYGQFVRYRRDRNLENGPLRIDGAAYSKGLALHAGTTLVFELGGEYATLRTVLGVDESVQTESRVEIIIEGNGRELYRGTIGRRDGAKPLTLDVKGMQQLRIDVRSTGLLDLGGEVSLADAKVSK
jgi:hypothetical protein